MRKLTTTLLAGAAAVAAAGSASAANPVTLIGTYIENSVLTNSQCFGQPTGTTTVGQTIFNFGGFGKAASLSYANTTLEGAQSVAATGAEAAIIHTTYSTGIPTGAGSGTWHGVATLSAAGIGPLYLETYTTNTTWIDKNTFTQNQTAGTFAGNCTTSVAAVRLGK